MSVKSQPFEHVQLREVVMVAALALAVYLLIPQLADVTGVWSSIKQANWLWGLWALGASALAFVAAAIGLMGAVPQRLPLTTTTAAQLAGSFVNRIVPARVGGMATNLRYLQKQGVNLARLPLPHRHVLAADPAGLADVRPAAAPRRPVDG